MKPNRKKPVVHAVGSLNAFWVARYLRLSASRSWVLLVPWV